MASARNMKISDRDKGAADLVRRMLEEGSLSIGVLGADAAKVHEAPARSEGADSGSGGEAGAGRREITIGEIAEIHEFGLGVPRRSFLADWADENLGQIAEVTRRGGRALVKGKVRSVEQLLEQIGVWAVGSIQTRMASNIPPPLADETIRRKGSSVSLIDTGQLRSSISYRVESSSGRGGGSSASVTGGAS